MRNLILTALAGALLATVPASALTYNWTFTPDTTTTYPGTFNPVSGTVSGLHEGSNDGSGIVFTVTQSDLLSEQTSNYVFEYSPFQSGPAFNVVDGAVTYADVDAEFLVHKNIDYALYLAMSSGGFSEIFVADYSSHTVVLDAALGGGGGGLTFTRVPSAVPEMASLGLMGLGVGLAGLAARRRRG